MTSMNTRLNIEKLNGNIVQKHGELQGAQGDHEAEVFQYGLSKVFWAEDTTMSTYLVNMSSSSAIEFKLPIDMLMFFSWLASIKQGMLEPVKVKCIFLGYRKGTGSMQVLHGFKFEVEPLGDHTFEVKPQENVDQIAGLQEVQTQDLMDYQLAHDREQHLACELFGYREDSNEAAFAVAAVEKIYAHGSLTFNNTVACEATRGLLDKAKENVPGMEIVRDQNGNNQSGNQSGNTRVQTLLEGHSILSLEGSLSEDCGVETNVGSQEYQVVCTRPDIASTGVDMLDGFDRGLQTNVQVFVDFDYTMGRSITVMSRSIVGYGVNDTEMCRKLES
ncbi:hypothetical protein Tco_0646947 [Tanacetum coccineum]